MIRTIFKAIVLGAAGALGASIVSKCFEVLSNPSKRGRIKKDLDDIQATFTIKEEL